MRLRAFERCLRARRCHVGERGVVPDGSRGALRHWGSGDACYGQACSETLYIYIYIYIWVVVKIMAPFWVPVIIRHLIFRVPKKEP